LNVIVLGKVFDNGFVGEESCLFEAINSFIDFEVNHVFGDVLIEVKMEHSFIRDLFTCYKLVFRAGHWRAEVEILDVARGEVIVGRYC